MFNHYLGTALRHFRRHKLTTAINLSGLTLGLICFFTAHSLAIMLENSDRQFPNADRIYSLTQKYIAPGANMSIPASPLTVWPVAEYLQTDMPQLEAVARITTGSEAPVTIGAVKTFAKISYADPAFFKIFAWRFVYGDAAHALADSRSVVLDVATATRLFGDPSKAIGQSIQAYGSTSLTVTGVIARPSGMSHMGSDARVVNFDIVAPMQLLLANPAMSWIRTNWNSPFGLTYVLLPADKSFTPEQLRARLQTFDERYVPKHEWQSKFDAVPLNEVFVSSINSLIGTEKSGVSTIELLYVLGAVVLFVSALNYANLATAQGTARAKEIGLRRVVGAGRRELANQYLGEALLMVGVAAITALLLVSFINGALADGTALLAAGAFFVSQLPIATLLTIGAGLAAGAYPALVLSRISVADALRSGRVRTGPRFLPTLLVGIQFAATSFLIVVILVMTLQHRKLEQTALNAGNPLVVLSNDLQVSKVAYETLRTELLAQPHVRSVTASMNQPWAVAGSLMPLSTTPEATARRVTVLSNYVERDYLTTMEIGLLAGRDFDSTRTDDVGERTIRNESVAIIDRSLAAQHGWTPVEAVGKQLYLWIPGEEQGAAPMTRVVGVVEDKPMRLLGMGATSNLYMLRASRATFPIIRIDGAHVQAALEEIDRVWEKLAPTIAIKRRFADEVLQNSMGVFRMVTTVIQAVSILALTIAVLGLIGMSLHIIGRRTHEIGVRKTLGASVLQVLTLLLQDFSKPVLIANLISWPLAFIAASVYLSIFVTRATLSPIPFLLSLLLTLGIAWLAVGAQATRAARLKPATVLRYE